jgi:hypothetical protein
MPAPSDEEVVILKSHIDRGLSLPPSYFLKGVLRTTGYSYTTLLQIASLT